MKSRRHSLPANFDASRLLDDVDTHKMDLAIGYEAFQPGQFHHRQRKLFTETYLCMVNGFHQIAMPLLALRIAYRAVRVFGPYGKICKFRRRYLPQARDQQLKAS